MQLQETVSRFGVPAPAQTWLLMGASRHTPASICHTSDCVGSDGTPATKVMPLARIAERPSELEVSAAEARGDQGATPAGNVVHGPPALVAVAKVLLLLMVV